MKTSRLHPQKNCHLAHLKIYRPSPKRKLQNHSFYRPCQQFDRPSPPPFGTRHSPPPISRYNTPMPRSPYFPRWRNLLMQMAMWLILGATVALAAILDRHLRLGQIIEFAPPVTDGPITFSLPAGWKTWTRQDEGDGSAYVATDSTAGVDRTPTTSSQRIPHLMPPAEYILRALPVSGDLSRDDFKSLSIDGWPAQNIRWAAQSVTLKAEAEVKFSTTTAV